MAPAIADMSQMCAGGHWATEDSLGIGGLLDAALRLAEFVFERGVSRRDLLRQLLLDANVSLNAFAQMSSLSLPAASRLAFRELGLAIGLHGLDRIAELVAQDRELAAIVNNLQVFRPLAEQVTDFWSSLIHRRSRTWLDHFDINSVMLATSLAPEGYA